MVTLLALMVFAQSAPHDTSRTRVSERLGARGPRALAFFEAFPLGGVGTSGACSASAPTGAKGEALTFARTSDATCSKKGLATTGIADGDLVLMSTDVARVEPDSDGVLGLRVETSRVNVLLESADISNAAYADVGTPTLTGSQTDPFGTTTAVTMQDDDDAAYEGRSQSVTVTAATAYVLSCYLKAGTLAKARLSLDGTACNVTGLSTSTWTRATCADASSSGTSVEVQLLAGTATGDTGTVKWGGCQVEAGTYSTSYIPTAGSAATRGGETAYFTIAPPSFVAFSLAATAQIDSVDATYGPFGVYTGGSQPSVFWSNSVATGSFCRATNTSEDPASFTVSAPLVTGPVIHRGACFSDGQEMSGNMNGTTIAPVAGFRTIPAATTARISTTFNGIVSRLCFAPNNPLRCR